MKGGLRSLVRSISPFTKSSSSTSKTSKSTHNNQNTSNNNDYDYASYSWDLSEVDLKVSLRHFYRKFNPEKAFIVNEILGKYVGEETQLLQQLCQRYKLTQNDMQEYLDMSNQHDSSSLGGGSVNGSKGLGAKKVRSSSFSTLSSRQRSEDGGSQAGGSPQLSNHGTDKKLKKNSRDRDDGSVASASSNYHRFEWDLSNVDVGKALTTVYKRYNPTKAPNLNAIKNKSDSEIISLLRQLCKRHGLSEEEMQDILDQSSYDAPDETSMNTNKRDATPTNLRATGGRGSYLQANNGSNPSINAPSGGKPAEIFSRFKNTNQDIPQFDDDFDDAEQSHQGFNSKNQHSLYSSDINQNELYHQDDEPSLMNQYPMQSIVAQPTSFGRRASAPPYQPPAAPQRNQQPAMSLNRNDQKFAGQDFFYQEGPRQRIPFQNNEAEDDDNWTQQDDYPQYSNFANTGESLPPPPPPPSQPTQLEVDQGLEIEKLRKELDEARQQVIDMSKDNQELTKNLKEARQELKTKYLKSAMPTASKSVQADDLITAAELQRLKGQLTAQEERSRKIEEEESERNQKIQKLEKNVALLQRKLKLIQADKSDLLQLINILSTAPIASKNVLESYLAKIAADTPNAPGLNDRIMDKSMSMGDRIDELLHWKREKEIKESDNYEKDSHDALLGGEDAPSSEDERYLIKGDDEDDDDEFYVRANKHKQKKVVPDTDELEALLTSPSEKKIYEQLMLNKKKATGTASSVASSSNRSYGSSNMKSLASGSKDLSNAEKTDILAEQYELAKKYFEHQRSQAKLSEQMAKTNLNLQEMETNKVVQSTQQPRSNHHSRNPSPNPMQRLNASASTTIPTAKATASASTAKTSAVQSTPGNSSTDASSVSVSAAQAPITVNDWMECYDPKSKRTYYFSATLKKSTWTKPEELKKSTEEPKNEHENASTEDNDTNNQQENTNAGLKEIPSSRSASPAVPLRSTTPNGVANRPTVASTRSRATSASSNVSTTSDPSLIWVTAVDPKTNRKFWYNRETKVSTWRKPADLI